MFFRYAEKGFSILKKPAHPPDGFGNLTIKQNKKPVFDMIL